MLQQQDSSNVPTPIPSGGFVGDAPQLVREFINNSDVPKDVRQIYDHFWFVFTRSVKLSFYREDQVQDFLNEFEIQVDLYKRTLPDIEWDEEKKSHINAIRTYYIQSLYQSVGDKSNMNLIKTMMAQYNISAVEQPQANQGGFLQRLFGVFKGR